MCQRSDDPPMKLKTRKKLSLVSLIPDPTLNLSKSTTNAPKCLLTEPNSCFPISECHRPINLAFRTLTFAFMGFMKETTGLRPENGMGGFQPKQRVLFWTNPSVKNCQLRGGVYLGTKPKLAKNLIRVLLTWRRGPSKLGPPSPKKDDNLVEEHAGN
ncbi:hypothetical protein COLO4_20625 [Corchorus olitorius]|uniref:Uncharacterized protein n=1 Tax=Corchorus olitorius TaxID=93759 RepID=A0A1R3IYM6_9ROSI|nr:hypothetical protein COLO4_20625 [Corchorus olitorius]